MTSLLDHGRPHVRIAGAVAARNHRRRARVVHLDGRPQDVDTGAEEPGRRVVWH